MSLTNEKIDNPAALRQIQCQRTRRFIPVSPSDSTAVCPWCDEHETYQRIGPEHEAWHHVRLATEMCRSEFDISDDGREALVWLGDRPETVFESHLDRFNMEHIGEAEHADRNRAGLVKEAERISRSEMLTVIGGRLPEGLYGQAYLAGEEFRQILGWETMKSLAVLRTSRGFLMSRNG